MSTDSTRTVLVVDGDDRMLDPDAVTLDSGWNLRTATTGAAAMDALDDDQPIDLVVLSSRLDAYGTDAVIREVAYRDLESLVLLLDDRVGGDRLWTDVAGRLPRPFDGASLRSVCRVFDALVSVSELDAGSRRTPNSSGPGFEDDEPAPGVDEGRGELVAELDGLRTRLADAGVETEPAELARGPVAEPGVDALANGPRHRSGDHSEQPGSTRGQIGG